MSRFTHNMLVVKGIVTAGFLTYLFVPVDYQGAVALGTNLLWLWRT